jgi:hypothetical protein
MSRPQEVHANSIAAYREEEPNLSRRAIAVLGWVRIFGPHTDREIMEGMGFTEPNAVRPRITELIDAGKLMEVGSIRCPVTGKTVRRVDIRQPRQFSLLPAEAETQ